MFSPATNAPRLKLREGALYQQLQRLDISRDELARRMGISSSTAWRVDQDLTTPSPKFIAALMRTTGEPFESLFEIVEAAA